MAYQEIITKLEKLKDFLKTNYDEIFWQEFINPQRIIKVYVPLKKKMGRLKFLRVIEFSIIIF